MVKQKLQLSYLQVKNLSTGTHCLGSGLYLRRTDVNSWYFFRYTNAAGKRRDMTLGNYNSISLKEAHAKARAAKTALDNGIDPILQRQQARKKQDNLLRKNVPQVWTFNELADKWLRYRVSNGYWANNPKGEKDTSQILDKHVLPSLGKLDIEKISAKEVAKCLSLIWQKIPSTARKAKTYIGQIITWSIAMEHRKNQTNPADLNGALGVLLEPFNMNRKEKVHHSACSVEELPLLMEMIYENGSISAKAVAFSILTAARSQAVRAATWAEFDLDAGIWNIPASHDKIKTANRDRTIFLSTQAIALLESLPIQTKFQISIKRESYPCGQKHFL